MTLIIAVLLIATLLIQGFDLSEWYYGFVIFLLLTGIFEEEKNKRDY